jgi:HSP20 family protein
VSPRSVTKEDEEMSKELERTRAWPSRWWDWEGPDLTRFFEGLRPWFRDADRLRIEQELTDDTLVIRAEMPGVDPDKDVEITVQDGVLHLRAERRSEEKQESEGRVRSEFHYGMFERALRVPAALSVDDVKANYKDGILEVRVPWKVPTEEGARKIPISRS